MSTNKTENYQLHAWEPGDDFLLSEINANFAAIDGALEEKAEVVAGCYVGDGAEHRTISLGFTPRMVMAASRHYGFMGGGLHYGGLARPEMPVRSEQGQQTILEIVEGGFRVYFHYDSHTYANLSGEGFSYLALR